MTISSRFSALAGLLCLLVLPAVQAQGQGQYQEYSEYDDPPGRVAYINHSEGEVSYSPAGDDVWLDMSRNRPLSRGDRLWTDRGSRLELQVGSGIVRLGAETSFEILELDDRISQILITEGVMNLTVRRMQRDEYYEIATPNLAFTIERAGRYRIDVDPRRDETTVVVWDGAGEAYGEGSTFPMRSGDTVRFYGADLRDYQVFGLPRADRFDRYCAERDRRLARSSSLRYVSPDMIGYASLDTYGSWSSDRDHGHVWFPTRVERDWAPYRDGRWVWQNPWGWTWVDNAPWGFAPSHYGRWVHVSNRWGWVPGPRNVRPVYAPALVAFVGGSRWSLNISIGGSGGNRGPIGWFPLGPRDVYVPSYRSSRDYFSRVNVNNTVINNTVINNVYNNYSSGTINVNQVNYANRDIRGAVTAVPSEVFVNSRPVRQQAIQMDGTSMVNAEIMRIAQVAPDRDSVRGAAVAAQTKPGREVFDRRVIARTAPPPAVVPIAAQVEELRKNPGRPVQQRGKAPDQARETKPQANIRVLQESTRAVNAREVAPQRGGAKPDAAPTQRKPLDREAEAKRPVQTKPAQRAADEAQPRQQQAAEQQRQREIEAQQQREQSGERQRQSDAREQQAARQREAAEQRQREVNEQQQREQSGERQRQSDAREQQAARQREAAEQRQREVNEQQQREQGAERQRQSDAREQQATRQREAAEQRQREVNEQQQREQSAERQRQSDAREQQATRQREAAEQRQREVNAQQQREQDAERQRQSDAREQQAARQREAAEQRQREVNAQQQREQAAERQRQSDAREQQAARQREAAAQRQQQDAEQERQRRAAEESRGKPQPAPVETRKPPRKDPRTDKEVDEEEDEDEKKDKRKDRDRR